MNNMKTRKHKYRGGAVFEGSEGCVFYPELKSKDGILSAKYPRRSGKFVTKIYVRPEDFKTELQGIALMKQVDPQGEFTRTFVDTAVKPDISSIDVKTEKCTKPITETSSTLYMTYSGTSILALKKTGKLNEVLKPVLIGLGRLSKLFVKMAALNIFHMDVQSGNLLFNKPEGKIYLIDFTSMKLLPGVTDKTIDIKALSLVILDILRNYRKSVGVESKCGLILSDIIESIYPKIIAAKDVEAIDTLITNSVDSVMKICFVGGRKTLRRRRH